MFSFILLEEETEFFFNVSVTFLYAKRQTMPRLSLDINGSKQLNASPWCFNYSLFKRLCFQEIKETQFPSTDHVLQAVAMFLFKAVGFVFEEKAQFIPLSFHLFTCKVCPRVRAQHRLQSCLPKPLLSTGTAKAGGFQVSPRTNTSWHL